jgi:lipoic acid synthetase
MSSEGHVRRPDWLRIRLRSTEEFAEVRRMMDGLSLTTVCEEARCPNIYECWSNRTATFMILGEVCTRQCGFCAVTSGLPPAPPDPDEPRRVAQAVKDLGLAHAVITSVDRDDLPDGGAEHFARAIEAVHAGNPGCAAEVLTPDFKGAPGALDTVLAARPEVFSHNTETVRRLYKQARPGSRYDGSLGLLRAASERRDAFAAALEQGALEAKEAAVSEAGDHRISANPAPYRFRVKTGLMVGLGETDEELRETFRDIRAAGVEVLTVGQYLQPTKDHLPVDRFVTPEQFEELRRYALSLGFLHVVSGPLVRSSYHAHEHRPDPQPLHVR